MIDWKHPNYVPVWEERRKRLVNLRENPGLIYGLKDFYKDNAIQFIIDWGVTIDPRNAELGEPTIVPFLPFPRQEQFITFVLDRCSNRKDGLAEK